MPKAIGIACAIISASFLGIGGYSSLAQQQAKTKLARPGCFNHHFHTHFVSPQGKHTIYVAGQVALNEKSERRQRRKRRLTATLLG